MMGNVTWYRHLLRMFRDSEGDFLTRFKAARATGDAATAARLAHDLESVAGTLAVYAVQQAAVALEQACHHEAEDADIDALAQNVARLLDPVITGLQALGSGPAPNPPNSG